MINGSSCAMSSMTELDEKSFPPRTGTITTTLYRTSDASRRQLGEPGPTLITSTPSKLSRASSASLAAMFHVLGNVSNVGVLVAVILFYLFARRGRPPPRDSLPMSTNSATVSRTIEARFIGRRIVHALLGPHLCSLASRIALFRLDRAAVARLSRDQGNRAIHRHPGVYYASFPARLGRTLDPFAFADAVV